MNNKSELDSLRTIAKLYYKQDFTQSEIAVRCGLSRPKVSRMLTEAREKGIVKIFIADENDAMEEMEEQILQKFHLKAVKIIPTPIEDHFLSQQIIAQEAATFMANLLEPNDIVGVSWGYTIYTIAKAFPTLAMPGLEVMQLSGNLDSVNKASRADEIINILSQKFKAKAAYTFPCPAMVDNPIILDTMLHDKKIKMLLEKASSCNKVIVNLAVMDENDCLCKGGYIDEAEMQFLRSKKVAGRICCRYINENGAICDEEMDRRTMGVSLADLKKKRFIMTCLSSEKKVPVLRAALKGEYINVLVINANCAEKLLNES